MSEAIFNYEGNNTIIQCETKEKMKDIIDRFLIKLENKENNLYYLYNGTKINYELTFYEQANDIDKKRNKMNILVTKKEEDNNEIKEIKEMKSKDIICPECKENTLIDIDNFKIHFHDCKNNHNINKTLYEFENSQKINLNNILCDICNMKNKGNSINNEFYICNTCNINLCPLCKKNHDRNHKIINYDDKNYICQRHNEPFIKYCSTHKKDICMLCETEHEGDKIIEFKNILIKDEEMLKSMKDLKEVIDTFKYKINIIKELLDRIVNTIDLYYKLSNNIINNYNINKRNYYILENLNNIKNSNGTIMQYINDLIGDDQIFNIYKFPNDYFYGDNDGIYIGELKNTYFKWIKEGKGIYYYYNGNKYEGDWENDEIKGKGIYYYKNGDRYEGDLKNNKREGKGIYYYKNGDRYEGECKDDKAEGKGIFYYNNGDKFEGFWKNNKKDGKGIMYYNNGKKEEGYWKDDNLVKN